MQKYLYFDMKLYFIVPLIKDIQETMRHLNALAFK